MGVYIARVLWPCKAIMTDAVILAGGLGTRLRPFTVTVPKPLLPLSDRPIVEVVLHQLQAFGFKRVCISLGYMAPLFKAFLGEGERFGLRIDYVVEEEPLGTAGALTMVPDLADNFVVLNGDTLTDLNYRALLDGHAAAGACATIFSHKVDEHVDYGVVEFDENGALQGYFEKPVRHYYVSTGIYALSKRILKYAKPKTRLDMPNLLLMAREAGDPVLCHLQKDAYWRDIGRFDHYELATKEFMETPERFIPAEKRSTSS